MSVFLKHGSDKYPPRIACFVCGAEGPADYPLFLSPHGASMDNKLLPHFPFLRELVPPLGLSRPQLDSTASSCRSCYTSLMKQWNDNDKGGVPLESRVYCHKRLDGLPVLQPEQQLAMNRGELSRYPCLVQSVSSVKGTRYTMPAVSSKSSVSQQLWVGCSSPLPPSEMSNPAIWKKMGPPSTNTPINMEHSVPDDNDSALDLSSGSRDRETMKSRSSVISHLSAASHHSSYQSEGAGSSTDILDLTLPDKNATTEVCYVCGDDYKKGTLSFVSTRSPGNKQPHYPSLVFHPRPPRSRPMDSAGRVQCCDECSKYLLNQWEQFEGDKLLHADRNYVLRKRQTNIVDTATFVCYICALDYHSSSLRLLYCRANSENEPYYPQIEQGKPHPGASPISSGGMVQVCSFCYKCTREKHQSVKTQNFEPPLKKRKSSRASVEILTDPDQMEDDDKTSPADIECILCRRKFTVHSFKFLHTQGPPFGGIPYFPFLKTLPRLNDEQGGFAWEEDSQGRVRVCQTCNTSLINQWTTYQRDALPIDERCYSYQSLAGPQSSGRGTPGDNLLTRATATPTSGRSLHSPGAPPSIASQQQSVVIPSKVASSESVRSRSNLNAAQYGDIPLKVAVSEPTPTAGTGGGSSRPRLNSEMRSNPQSPRLPVPTQPTQHAPPASHSPRIHVTQPHSPRIPISSSQPVSAPAPCHSPVSVHSGTSAEPSHKPSTSSFYCFLCSLHSELSFARILYSRPQGKKAPYFPFMKDHVPKPRAETMREDGSALVCTFCYHSVMIQWTRFQESRCLGSANSRKYNINDYVCYVCGVQTYRKRIRALRVANLLARSAQAGGNQDFPFLRNHHGRKGTVTMENGEMAAVCLDCYETLKSQFSEAAKYGIPVEKRQYNWMQVPPPPEESGAHLATPKERMDKLVSQC